VAGHKRTGCIVQGCTATFKDNRRTLERHMKTVHSAPSTFVCSCGKGYSRKDNLVRHSKRCRHRGMEGRTD
jgi:uncharacterized Zn-finger protein